MGTFLTYFLILWGIMVVFYKYNAPERIRTASNKIKSKFLYNLSECEFCMEHHVGIIPAGIFVLVLGFDWLYLIYPFMAAALSNIVKTIRTK